MDSGGRKRRRKAQSFKLVTDGGLDCSSMRNFNGKGSCGEAKVASVPEVWQQDESMGIKRQTTGMMGLLSDRTTRVYNRAGAEQQGFTVEPPAVKLMHWPAFSQPASAAVHQSSAVEPDRSPAPVAPCIPNDSKGGFKSTSSQSPSILKPKRDLVEVNGKQADAVPPAASPEAPCCLCNCKGTLKAILHELRSMRRLMQSQKASFERQGRVTSRFGAHHSGPTSRCRLMKRKLTCREASSSNSEQAAAPPLEAFTLRDKPGECGNRDACEKEDLPNPVSSNVSLTFEPMLVSNTQKSPENRALESEVRLAEDYDVFISKAQLDSILINYTRSGSLLFRKLVCAFFDDATLANSLPNGKRKRGLNDNRKGLDQNIVGAIKVFTEKYCTKHGIEKLPGPRDWVQILQDQIKLARRRLKRDAVDSEVFNQPLAGCADGQHGGLEPGPMLG